VALKRNGNKTQASFPGKLSYIVGYPHTMLCYV